MQGAGYVEELAREGGPRWAGPVPSPLAPATGPSMAVDADAKAVVATVDTLAVGGGVDEADACPVPAALRRREFDSGVFISEAGDGKPAVAWGMVPTGLVTQDAVGLEPVREMDAE